MRVGLIQSIEGPDRIKGEGRTNCPFLSWDIHLLSSHIGDPGSQTFGLRLMTPLAFPGLQVVDSRSWEFSASIITCVTPIINLLWFSGEPYLIHSQNLKYLLSSPLQIVCSIWSKEKGNMPTRTTTLPPPSITLFSKDKMVCSWNRDFQTGRYTFLNTHVYVQIIFLLSEVI